MKKKQIEQMKIVLIMAFVAIAAIILIGLGNQGQLTQTNGNKQVQNVNSVLVGVVKNSSNGTLGMNVSAGTNTSANNSQTQTGNGCQMNSVYFIHADWCPHCQKMAPWVSDLETKGYSFVGVTSDNLATYKDCLTGVAQMQYIPEFVCLSNKGDHVGEFSDENTLQAFADACGAGPQ